MSNCIHFLVVTIYLGTIIYFKTNNGLGVLIAWNIWVVGVPLLLEIIDIVIRRRLQSNFLFKFSTKLVT